MASIQAGTKSNVIPDQATIALNVRSFHDSTRSDVLDAIRRIVVAECAASRSPTPPEFELFDRFPLTENHADVTRRVAAAFDEHFGSAARELPPARTSPTTHGKLGAPYTYWGIGGIDPKQYETARAAGRSPRTFR